MFSEQQAHKLSGNVEHAFQAFRALFPGKRTLNHFRLKEISYHSVVICCAEIVENYIGRVKWLQASGNLTLSVHLLTERVPTSTLYVY